MQSHSFEYNSVTSPEEPERIISEFCRAHGDSKEVIIPDDEFDKLFDHLVATLSKVGTFAEGGLEEADFSGSRYVDQIPWMTIVPSDKVTPAKAVQAAISAIETAHRPMGVSFDFPLSELLVFPGPKVLTTFQVEEVTEQE